MAPKAGDLVFLDTNILLTATDSSRKNHRPAKAVFTQALNSGVHLCASGQIIREYLVMQIHNIRTLLTENIDDFSTFSSLETLTLGEFEGYGPPASVGD